MLNALLEYSLSHRLLVMFAAVGLALAGAWAFLQL